MNSTPKLSPKTSFPHRCYDNMHGIAEICFLEARPFQNVGYYSFSQIQSHIAGVCNSGVSVKRGSIVYNCVTSETRKLYNCMRNLNYSPHCSHSLLIELLQCSSFPVRTSLPRKMETTTRHVLWQVLVYSSKYIRIQPSDHCWQRDMFACTHVATSQEYHHGKGSIPCLSVCNEICYLPVLSSNHNCYGHCCGY